MRINIDLVVLWCDGNDPEHARKRSEALGQACPDSESVGDFRFRDNGELKMLLRGAEKFAPWLHNIFRYKIRLGKRCFDKNSGFLRGIA
jgi:hypothetical protein